MKVDLERLRRSLARYAHAEENAVPVAVGELAALLAVVDAARAHIGGADTGTHSPLADALEPFTPPADRAWEEIDRWNAEQERRQRNAVVTFDAPQQLYPKPDPRPNPRDRARDQLADAGVTVQRQFRSDQERIAELERERDELETELVRRQDNNFLEERIAELESERDEWKGRHKAVTNGLSNHVARADRAEERLAKVPTLVDALRALVAAVDDAGPGAMWTMVGEDREQHIRAALAGWAKP